jgi:hypothetical protein
VFAVLVLGIIVLASGTVRPDGAAAYNVCIEADDYACVHEYMAEQAIPLFEADRLPCGLGSTPDSEICVYFADIRAGVTHEDEKDHIFSYYWLNTLVTITHFWDADRGANDPVVNVLGSFPNALQKARALWSIALGEYSQGDKAQAYHYLGHVVHLLGDATIPTHVHDDMHGPDWLDDDAFEEWMSLPNYENAGLRDCEEIRPPLGICSDPRHQTEREALLAMGPIQIPASEQDKLLWLLYTTNQIADFFPSDCGPWPECTLPGGPSDGDTDDPLGYVQTELDEMASTIARPRRKEELLNNDFGPGPIIDNSDNNDRDGDLSVIRQHSYLRGIPALAALYRLWEETISQPRVTVVINNVEQLEWHDWGCVPLPCVELTYPDFYARVDLDGVDSRNRGDAIHGQDIISPGWPFARVIDPALGAFRVQIQILDHDGEWDDFATSGGPDDTSDITAGGGTALDLMVNPALCLAGADGAVYGEVTGKCGEQLVSSGEDYFEASRITFTIEVSDFIPPSVSCGAADGAWHATDVSIPCTASDIGSGLADPADAAFSLSTSVPAGTETDDAQTGTRTVCDLAGNCTAAGPIAGNKVDKKAPAITIVQPAAAQYVHSATLTLDYAVVDGGSGLNAFTSLLDGGATLAGHGLQDGQPISLLTELPLGLHTFRIDATDNVGNAATASVTFEIIVTAESIKDDVRQFLASGDINNLDLGRSLLQKLDAAARARAAGRCATASNIYRAFINEVRANSPQKISAPAAAVLIADAGYLITHCP